MDAGREVEGVDVVGPVLFDDLDEVPAQPRQQGRDGDRRQDADDDAEHRQRAAELVRADAVERHRQNLFGELAG